jgi:hypothetical protein
VNECAEFVEFISAYADIELSDADKKRVEEHLATCANCSALLELCREISAAANESSAPAPEALRSGVMEKVRSEGTPRTAGNVRRLGHYRVVLTRYAPLAACLAVVLLTMPFLMSRIGRENMMPVSAPPAQMAVMEDSEMNRAPQPAAPAAPHDSIYGDDNDASPVFPAPPADSPPPAEPAPGTSRTTDAPPPQAADRHGAGTGERYTTDLVPPVAIDIPADWDNEADGAIFDSPNVTPYYAFIEITGELPESLSNYSAVTAEGVDDTTRYILIPREEAKELIELLRDRAGVVITQNYIGGDYALVINKPE